MNLDRYNKLWVALAAALVNLVAVTVDGHISLNEGIGAAAVLVGSLAVYQVRNGIDPDPTTSTPKVDRGFVESTLIWSIVGILAIIALVIWILANV